MDDTSDKIKERINRFFELEKDMGENSFLDCNIPFDCYCAYSNYYCYAYFGLY